MAQFTGFDCARRSNVGPLPARPAGARVSRGWALSPDQVHETAAPATMPVVGERLLGRSRGGIEIRRVERQARADFQLHPADVGQEPGHGQAALYQPRAIVD